ncbi:EpsG family protein [Tissierella creatinini]|nr:EpsG family protein [Tissierella creatinini]TJX61548.1 EpsG family protein [Soehngenia saccharolytica]
MDIYSAFMLMAVLARVLLPTLNRNTDNHIVINKRRYCILMGFILFLITALRSISVGFDSEQYSRHYYLLHQMGFKDIINIYKDELGFYFIIKTLTYISSNHQLMFTFIGAIYAFFISRFIYKYSKDSMVSFIMLITMSYFAFSMTGLRQTIALSILLLSIDYIIGRKLSRFIILVFLGSLFHKSAIFFLPAYFLKTKKISFKKIILYIISTPLVFLLRPLMINIVQKFIYEGYLVDYNQLAGGWTTLFIYSLILAVATILKPQMEKTDDNFPLFFSMMYMGMLIQMFVPLQANIFRVSMYYNIASIILIPGILKTQKDKISKLVSYVIFFILMGVQYYMFTFYAAGVNPYRFFWQ